MEKKIKTLGVNIDGVIREFHNQFDKQYRKVFIHNPSLVGVNEETHSFREYTKEEDDKLSELILEKERDLITLPVDSFELINHYKFDSKTITMTKLEIEEDVNYAPIEFTPKENLEQFLELYSFQIYGMAEEYTGAMEAVNKIQHIGLTSGLFDVVLLSSLKSKSIASTYTFLGKVNCRIRKIEFVSNESDKWNHCDALVDIMPVVFQTKPQGKTSIKINHLFNQWDAADFSYDSIKDICNKDFLNRIFKKTEQ